MQTLIEQVESQLNISESNEQPKMTHHFKVKTDHASAPVKGSTMRVHSRKGLDSARDAAQKHYESQGHTNVQLTHIKTTPHKDKKFKTSPEQRMKGRERHFNRTGVSKGTTDWLKARGML